jgi:DNA segregation ATPase FtsK/SpoIIIE, S-DNA-T family
MVKKSEETHRYLTREIPGLAMMFLTAILLLALISHDPLDPSFLNYHGHGDIHNYIGLTGAYISALLVDLLGLTSFWAVLALGLSSWRFIKGGSFAHPRLVICGHVLLVLTLSSLFSMIFPRLVLFWPETPGGGLLGDFLSHKFIEYFNPVGAVLVVIAVFLVALILCTGLSLIRAVDGFFRRLQSVGKKMDEARDRRREKAERSRRLEAALSRRKEQDPPVIKEKKAPLNPNPKPKQEKFEFLSESEDYRLPGSDLLDEPPQGTGGMKSDSLMANARLVEKKLSDFHVTGEVVEVSTGPVITMYEYQPAPGVKISKVAGLADDLAMNMRAEAIRIIAPLPGKGAIGIEIPNPKREFVFLKEVISSPVFQDAPSLLTLVLGVDTMGNPEVADLTRMPHLLIAGATGSGKSVGLNAIIMSILFKARPNQVKFLMIDPKRIELSLYKDLPHLIYPVVSDPKEANQALKWAVGEMELRYKLLAEKGVRNIETYNRKILKELHRTPSALAVDPDSDPEEQPPALPAPLPYLVIIIDELADLMMVSAKDVEASITRLAQMARAAGIHLILATQRPSVDVLTGVIKANMPTRISFQVSSRIDSRTILDATGAEKLLGMGDMLFLPPGTGRIHRIHGAYVSEAEIKQITEFIKAQQPPDYMEKLEVALTGDDEADTREEYDEKYDEAVELVTRTRKASISLIQRHLRIGYNRAARIIEIMEKEGVVGPADGAKPREVLASRL